LIAEFSSVVYMITPHLFEAYLKCPTKSFLRALGETGMGNPYADWAHAQSVSYQHEGTMSLRQGFASGECNAGPLDRNALKSAKWRLAIDSKVCVQNLESTIHALKRAPCDTPGRPAEFTPIRFIFANTLARHDRLLLAFDALVLSETLGREVDLGEIIHGDDCVTLRVRTAALHSEVRKIAAEITTLLFSRAAPDLVLNRHCAECEFRDRCRQKAIESDDLSLLSNMTESERKHFARKGIFTVKQLSYTFRPRKRPKHMRDRREPYHHSLKALAIRERKIHIVGSPTLTVSGTPVFLDVECVPDRGFYYLIGMRVSKNGSFIQHSFWADTPQDERRIWTEFLQTLVQLDNPILLHYGSFESTFLRRMRERYPDAEDNAAFVAKVSTDAVNVLAFIYGQVYFPTYSNGLKEIAGSLGFEWPDPSGTGPTSVFWRHQWDESLAPELRQKLLAYNAADCEALELLTNALGRLLSRPTDSQQCLQGREIAFVTTELPNVFSHPSWQPFKGAMPELDAINQAAHWDYQRDRIYLRLKTSLNRRAKKRHAHERLPQGVEQILSCPERPVCPRCLRQSRRKADRVSLLLQDLVFGSSSVKRRAVRYEFQEFWCPQCEYTFGLDERFKANTKFGWNLIALYFYMAVDICIPQRSVARIFQRLFNLFIPTGSGSYLKTRIAQYYDQTATKAKD
jgi:predicted RecB family nuclease